jgi:hypothetical protein
VATLFPVFEANPMDAAAVELDLSPVRSLVGMAAVWPIEHLVLLQQAANSEKKRIIHCHIQRQKSGRDSTKLSAMTIATSAHIDTLPTEKNQELNSSETSCDKI